MKTIIEFWHQLRDAGKAWSADNASRLAAAVAFYSILSIAPLLILAVAIAGLMFDEGEARRGLIEQMRGLVGEAGSQVAETALENAKKPKTGVLATLIGIATLLLGASGVFGELHGAMNVIWKVRSKPGLAFWSLLRDKFLCFGMVLTVGFLLLVTLVISTCLTAMSGWLNGMVPGLPVLMSAANFIISFLVVALLFALIFRYLPDVWLPWQHIWFGAAVTSLLFVVGKFAIGMYLAKAAVGSPFGAAGSLVALVVWIDYSAMILFFGAELTRVHAEHAGASVEPTARAERIPPETTA